jgi:hypothetical protein
MYSRAKVHRKRARRRAIVVYATSVWYHDADQSGDYRQIVRDANRYRFNGSLQFVMDLAAHKIEPYHQYTL